MNSNYEKMWKDLEETLTKAKRGDPSIEIISEQILQLMNRIKSHNEQGKK
jgi:hypothetical protein